MTKITGGKACVEVLKGAGVEAVFGLLGGSMLELYDALRDESSIRYIGARDERAAGHMADAYARVSASPGIVLGAQAGPGVANLVTAVAEAHLAYSPLVAIAGAITRKDLGKDTFQEFDQLSVFQPIAKRSIMVPTPERLPEMLHEAMHLAMSGRRGPVVLHAPRDLFSHEIDPPTVSPVTCAAPGAPTAEQLTQIMALLEGAARPIIFAGAGFKSPDGSSVLAALAEALSVPVVTSTGHLDVLPADHRWLAGQTGPRGNACAAAMSRQCDLILALGTRLAFNSTFLNHDYVNKDAKIVHVDTEASAVGRYFPAALGIQAGAAETADMVRAEAEKAPELRDRWKGWADQFDESKSALTLKRSQEESDDAVPMKPHRVLGEIRNNLPRNAILTLDTGNACLQAADRVACHQCPAMVTPLDFGLVGFGYAAALGAQAAAPDRPVISIMGDGGFGFTMSELTTAVAYDLPVIAVVLDNGAWGAEKAYQRTFFDGRTLGADIESPAYDKVAELCGAAGYAVSQPGDTAKVLQEALTKKKPSVIHVKVDPEAINALRKDLFEKPK
ncbi:MAG: thiamine pyrophosphate-binding protein [Alphaproteobacteria bacterium]|nr:thiamine pyrophosphate-binding protein [Alphaproteobacteria bacterium]